ncbi:amino acid ABC transporter permease [Rhodococcus koreensis]
MTLTNEASAPVPSDIVYPRRNYPQIVASVLVLLVLVLIARAVFANDNFQWDVVREYFFSASILEGLWMTIRLTVIAVFIGSVLGIPLAVMRQSANPLVRHFAFGYVWFFRGTPLLVQLVFWFNIALLFPTLTLKIPFGPTLLSEQTNTLVTPLTAAVLALGLNQAAYTAEIVRAGLISVDKGQTEAAVAIGMTKVQTLHKIILPQAMRVIIPPLASETINMLKVTSLVSVISLGDLLYSAQAIYQANYKVIPLLLVASIWYLLLVTVLSVGQYYLERYFSRGYQDLRKPPKEDPAMTEPGR